MDKKDVDRLFQDVENGLKNNQNDSNSNQGTVQSLLGIQTSGTQLVTESEDFGKLYVQAERDEKEPNKK